MQAGYWLMAKMYEDPSVIFIVFFKAMIELTDMFLIEETDHPFLELAAAFSRDDLDEFDAFLNRFFDHPIQLLFDQLPAIVNIVQIKF